MTHGCKYHSKIESHSQGEMFPFAESNKWGNEPAAKWTRLEHWAGLPGAFLVGKVSARVWE